MTAQQKLTPLLTAEKNSCFLRNARVVDAGERITEASDSYRSVFILGDQRFSGFIFAIFRKDFDISWFMQQILLATYSDC